VWRTRWASWFPRDDIDLQRYVRTVRIAILGSLVVELAILWGLQLNPLRSALGRPDLANFYDIQARALFHGHLDVPLHSLGIEGFVEHGREYMYFTPGPALARMPLLLVTSWFDGKLTAISMLLAWSATVVLLAMLIWRIRRILRGKAPLPQWEATSFGLLVVAGTAGSVLLYLASSPWVYHEAYAWSIATAMAAIFTMLGVVQRPTVQRALLCGGAVLAAVLCRATTGWAMGLGAIATAVWLLRGARGDRGRQVARVLLAAAVVPLLIGVAINEVKFSTPMQFKLEDQRWTRVNAHRREALRENGGDLVALDLLPSTSLNYFRPDGIRLIPVPPFVTFPNRPAHAVGGGFLDQTYRTGSAVPFMPALVLLGVWGLVITFRPRGPTHASWLRIPVLSAGAITGAIMIFGYISYRYLSELLPVLLVAATIGLVDLGHLLTLRTPKQRSWFVRSLAGLTAVGVVANFGVGLTALSLTNPGPHLDRYLGLQESISNLVPGDPLAGMVDQGPALPDKGPGEHLFIVGDCAALYVSLAETYWPWVPAEVRPMELSITNGLPPPTNRSRTSTGSASRRRIAEVKAEVAHMQGQDGRLYFELSPDRWYRLHYISERGEFVSHWREPGDTSVTLRTEADVRTATYTAYLDGTRALRMPLEEVDKEWFRFEDLLLPSRPDRDLTRLGLVVRQIETEKPARCARLQAKAT
jgi:hypothetical protein